MRQADDPGIVGAKASSAQDGRTSRRRGLARLGRRAAGRRGQRYTVGQLARRRRQLGTGREHRRGQRQRDGQRARDAVPILPMVPRPLAGRRRRRRVAEDAQRVERRDRLLLRRCRVRQHDSTQGELADQRQHGQQKAGQTAPSPWGDGPPREHVRLLSRAAETASVAVCRLYDQCRSQRAVAFRRLLHQRQGVAVRVGEERHPEIVVLHGRDQMRPAAERHATLRCSSWRTAKASSAGVGQSASSRIAQQMPQHLGRFGTVPGVKLAPRRT